MTNATTFVENQTCLLLFLFLCAVLLSNSCLAFPLFFVSGLDTDTVSDERHIEHHSFLFGYNRRRQILWRFVDELTDRTVAVGRSWWLRFIATVGRSSSQFSFSSTGYRLHPPLIFGRSSIALLLTSLSFHRYMSLNTYFQQLLIRDEQRCNNRMLLLVLIVFSQK
mgnify:CR=1 FL=1